MDGSQNIWKSHTAFIETLQDSRQPSDHQQLAGQHLSCCAPTKRYLTFYVKRGGFM